LWTPGRQRHATRGCRLLRWSLDSSINLPGQTFNPDFDKEGTLILTGSNLDAAGHLAPVQTLYLKSGTARVLGAGVIATRPCIAGYFCPPAAP
jgi:hypothetical protein